jgi:internalin A
MIFSLFACGPEAPTPAPSGSEVVFPDANLEAAIREKIGKPSGSIQQRDLEFLSDLEAHGRGITDLTGLEYCANLTALSLTSNLISDISPLAQLTNLRELGLSMNHIRDIAPLASLSELNTLQLNINNISDISPLASLSELKMLQLNSNYISDISSLSSLTNLEIIDLGDNRISDISALQSLVNLKQVGLFMNQIGEIAPLVLNPGIGAGDQVFLADNHLDLSAAAGDKQKRHYLLKRGVQVDTRGQEYVPTYEEPPPDGTVTFPDQNLDRIIRELIGKTLEENITAGDLEQTTEIYADDSNISDLSGIQYCYNLRILHLPNNRITDISPLASLTNLLALKLWDNQISDISPVRSLSNLQILNLNRNQISDVAPLNYHIQLHTVDLGHNNISDISTLQSLYGIRSLKLQHNQISNISSLVQNPGLDEGDGLYLNGNNLDLSEGSEDMQSIRKLEDRRVNVRW